MKQHKRKSFAARKRISLCAVFLALALLLPGCRKAPPEQVGNPNFGGTVRLFAYSPDQSDPITTTYPTNAAAYSILFNSLVQVHQDLTITPELADSWTFSGDGQTCTLALKSGVTFHDGTPVTSRDVAATLDKIKQNNESMYFPIFEYVVSYTARSDSELVLNLTEPGNNFLYYMDFPVQKSGQALVGSGPFQLVSNDNKKMVLTATKQENALEKPNIETIEIVYYPKEDMAEYAFTSGEIDVISADYSKLGQLSSKVNTTKTEYISDQFTFFGFNTQKAPFDQAEVRRAIASLIDKAEMTKTILVDYAVSTSSPYKPGTWLGELYQGDYGYDVAAAVAHLQNAGQSNLSFSILVNSESPAKEKTAQFMKEKLKAANINASIRALPFEEYTQAVEAGNYDTFIGEITMEQDYDLRFLLNQNNYFGYTNDYLSSVLNQFISTVNDEKRKSAALEIQNMLINDLPFISLYYKTNVLLVDDKVKGEFKPRQKNIYENIASWIAK